MDQYVIVGTIKPDGWSQQYFSVHQGFPASDQIIHLIDGLTVFIVTIEYHREYDQGSWSHHRLIEFWFGRALDHWYYSKVQ